MNISLHRDDILHMQLLNQVICENVFGSSARYLNRWKEIKT